MIHLWGLVVYLLLDAFFCPLSESGGNFLLARRAVSQTAGDPEPKVCGKEVLAAAEAWC